MSITNLLPKFDFNRLTHFKPCDQLLDFIYKSNPDIPDQLNTYNQDIVSLLLCIDRMLQYEDQRIEDPALKDHLPTINFLISTLTQYQNNSLNIDTLYTKLDDYCFDQALSNRVIVLILELHRAIQYRNNSINLTGY